MRVGLTNGREGLEAGFAADSMERIDVDPSVTGGPGDEALADAIRRELLQDSATAALEVNVRVEEGVAYLSGRVGDLDDVENAEEVAGRVSGVREVVENLEIP
jgi:osmotically-inducible protein OsmY